MKFFGWCRTSKWILLSVCGAAIISLTGCWDRRELGDMSVILATGVDKIETGAIELSIQIFVPKRAGGGASTFVRSATGATVGEALSKLREKSPRETFWGHDKILVIGEKLAKEGIRDIVDILMRFPEARVRLKVFISQGSARHALELQPPLEQSTANVLWKMTELHSIMNVPIKSLAQMLAGNAGAAAVPWVVIHPEPNRDKVQTIPYVKGTTVFKKDKMIGRIDEDVTKGVLWLRNEIKTNVVTVIPIEKKGIVTLNVVKSKSELLPQFKDNRWSITAKIKPEARLIENTTNLSFKDPKLAKQLENDLNEIIENRVKTALAQVQKEMHADIFNFAETFYRKYPKEWEQIKDKWDEVFPNVQVQIQVASKLLSPGIVDTGINRPAKEVKKK